MDNRAWKQGRKVRSPQGGVPANGRGPVTDTESATENIPPVLVHTYYAGKGEMVR
jgi:hypothetical protein